MCVPDHCTAGFTFRHMRYTAWVPGKGLVTWPVDELVAYADALSARHRPRWRFGSRKCRECRRSWPCAAHVWASREISRYRAGVS